MNRSSSGRRSIEWQSTLMIADEADNQEELPLTLAL
jgi:hypothetical protein